MYWKQLVLLCFAVILVAVLSSCSWDFGSESDDTATTPESTEASNPSADATQIPTEEQTPEVNLAVTEPVTSLEVNSVSSEDEYYIAVSYALEQETVSDLTLPEGHRWLLVVATLANQGGESISIAAENLALVDRNGERYTPEAPNTRTQPPMVGAELDENESIVGLALFAIPDNVQPYLLEWCLDTACEQAIQSLIP